MNIRFGSPNIKHGESTLQDISRILRSGWVSIGKHAEALESHFKTKFNMKHAIATSSATTGLIIAIKAAGWKNNDVHIPSFTWPSTLYAVNCNGNRAICHDIEPDTWLMTDPQKFGKDDCIVPVDIFGNQAPVHIDFPKEKRIYDAAHGYGLSDLGKRGIAEVVSLSFTKVVTSMEGGMILTDDDELADTATELRRLSGRMGEINALVALKSIENYKPNETSFAVNHYKKHIMVPHKCQEVLTDTNNSVFSLLYNNSVVRDTIRIALEKAGVETKVYYDPLFRGYRNTEDIYSRILSLPTHEKAMEHQDDIIEIINTAGRGAGTPGKEFLIQ